ncbi:MAG: GHMP family kinase ATP-binding protein [Shimia sp.]
MIVTKTPLRLPLAGGLTDLKAYAHAYGGVTVSMAIDKHVYVVVKPSMDGFFDLRYTDVHEKVLAHGDIRNDLIREALRLTGLTERPVHLVVMTDLAGESGLGTSGAVCVGLLNAMWRLQGVEQTAQSLLEMAAHIEVDVLGGASGYHDPAICALGDVHFIEYDAQGIRPTALTLPPDIRAQFQDSLLLFYGGHHAQSKPSLNLLESHMDDGLAHLHEIKAIGTELRDALPAGDLRRVGEILGEQQRLKMTLPGKFVDDYVTDIVAAVRARGAYAQLPGGKISAFVMVFCPDGQQSAIRDLMGAAHTEVPFRIEPKGTTAQAV